MSISCGLEWIRESTRRLQKGVKGDPDRTEELTEDTSQAWLSTYRYSGNAIFFGLGDVGAEG